MANWFVCNWKAKCINMTIQIRNSSPFFKRKRGLFWKPGRVIPRTVSLQETAFQ
jgi:hypothetical protein